MEIANFDWFAFLLMILPGIVIGALIADESLKAKCDNRVKMTVFVRKSISYITAGCFLAAAASALWLPAGLAGVLFGLPLGYVIVASGGVARHDKNLELANGVANALTADEYALVAELDHDADTVVSERDLGRVHDAIIHRRMKPWHFRWLKANLRQVGHALDDDGEVFIINRNDVRLFAERVESQYAEWRRI